MNIPDSFVAGTVYYYDSKEELAKILVGGGIDVSIGIWALRIPGFARTFEIACVGNITPEAPFEVDGDGYGVSVESVARDCERLSECLQRHGTVGQDGCHASPRPSWYVRCHARATRQTMPPVKVSSDD